MSNKQYWNKEFYWIEYQGGEKYVRVVGYFYDEGEDNGHGTARCVEYSGFEFKLIDFLENWTEDDYSEMEGSVKSYIEDMTTEEAIICMNTYDELPVEMPMDEINMETPCGYYVNYKEK